MQIINKQVTQSSRNERFNCIIKSEQGQKEFNTSEDNSGPSFASPIEKMAASVDYNENTFNSQDNQELLNEIMDLQRFPATLDK